MTYKEKLKSPKWQKKRLEILNRDDFTCQLCMNEEKMLIVHHKKYLNNKNPWEYENKFMITLCESCHDKIHRKIKIKKEKPNVPNIRDLDSKVLFPDENPRVIKNISIRESLESLRNKKSYHG